ncbi:MAG TPA: phosphatidylglycerol lysyltransferase domain-containing protein [bacterium]|nr:phosphatidylglycerol lysyltransferase domain-containing protein [bacterium]HPN30332.1 phosphatidylglycerol lysyltransferase domain-containing protein [bacterium]
METFNFNNLKKIEIEDKPVLTGYLKPCNNILCDYNFTNLYSWGHIFQTKWALFENSLILYNSREDYILSPCANTACRSEKNESGEILRVTPEKLINISDSFIKSGKSGNFILLDKDFVEKLKDALEKWFDIIPDENNADYIYSTIKLVELKGKKLHKKKNLISQFVRENPDYVVAELTPADKKACFDLSEKWCKTKNCDKLGFSHETSALLKVFEKFEELEAGGLVIKLKNEPVAFSVFSKQNSETYTVHYEKFDSEIKGAGQIINWETAKYLLDKCKYINREQDMGIEGLRQAKKSYDPDFILLTYKLIRKK